MSLEASSRVSGPSIILVSRATLGSWISAMPRPKGSRGENAIGLAVMVGKIATGEIEDDREVTSSAAAQLGSLGGKKRATNMTPSGAKR